jgi:hypothetical protein
VLYVFLEGFVLVIIIWLFPGDTSIESITIAVEGFEGDCGGVNFEDKSEEFGIARRTEQSIWRWR